MPTLKRYNYFVKEKDFILEHDYCFYFDADMRIDGVVEAEEVCGDLVATRHGYQSLSDPASQTFDRNPSHLLMFLLIRRQSLTMLAGSMVARQRSLWKWQILLLIELTRSQEEYCCSLA